MCTFHSLDMLENSSNLSHRSRVAKHSTTRSEPTWLYSATYKSKGSYLDPYDCFLATQRKSVASMSHQVLQLIRSRCRMLIGGFCAASMAGVDRPWQTTAGSVSPVNAACSFNFLFVVFFCSRLCSASQTAHWFLNAALKSFSPSSSSLLQLLLHCAAMRRHHNSICHFRGELHQSSADASARIRSEGTISSQKDPALFFFFLPRPPARKEDNGSMQNVRNISPSLHADSRAAWKQRQAAT